MRAGALRRRWTQWWQARHRPCERLQLTQRNVYILPTAAGGMLALTVLVMLIASINFQLNMGYLLTFLLAGSATAGMLAGHATLRGLTLHLRMPEPVFAGQHCVLRVQLHNPTRAARYGVGLTLAAQADSAGLCSTVAGTAALDIAWLAPARGRLALGLYPLSDGHVSGLGPLATGRDGAGLPCCAGRRAAFATNARTAWRKSAGRSATGHRLRGPAPLPRGRSAQIHRLEKSRPGDGARQYRPGEP